MIDSVDNITSRKTLLRTIACGHSHVRRGFTLIEMLLALGIFVLVITTIAPVFFSTQDRLGLENKAKEIGAVVFDTRTKSLQGFQGGTKAVVLSTNPSMGAGEVTIPTASFEDTKRNAGTISSLLKKENNILSSAVGEQRAKENPFYKIDSMKILGTSSSEPSTVIILFEPLSSNTLIYANGTLVNDVTGIEITLSSIIRPHIKKTMVIDPMTGITQ